MAATAPGIAATVIHYRPRSAVREVGKVLGFSEDVTARLTSTIWGSFSSSMAEKRYAEAGFDPDNPDIVRLRDLVDQILHFPRCDGSTSRSLKLVSTMTLAPAICAHFTGMPRRESDEPQRPGPMSRYGRFSACSWALKAPTCSATAGVSLAVRSCRFTKMTSRISSTTPCPSERSVRQSTSSSA